MLSSLNHSTSGASFCLGRGVTNVRKLS